MEMFKKEAGKKLSLDAFKAKADAVTAEESLDKIGGGIYQWCHSSLAFNPATTISLSANLSLNTGVIIR